MRGDSRPSEAILRAVLESPKDIVIFALDRSYRYIAFNENHRRTMKAIWNADITIGMCMLDIIKREDDLARARCHFDRALAGESFTMIEQYGDERRKRRFYEDVYSPILNADGAIIGLTVYLTDITEQRENEIELSEYRRRLEALVEQRTRELEAAHAQLLHAQKMESLGVMAGGIAHDFNNLLGVILGSAGTALRSSALSADIAESLDRVRAASIQGRTLIDQLLAYSGRTQGMMQALDLNELATGMHELLEASVARSVQLVYELQDGLPPVEADASQMRQVLMNLVINGGESIVDSGGRVVIRTHCMEVDEAVLAKACLRGDVEPGQYVCLEVTDNGAGMDAEIQQMLFDPFFTTKFSGRGLGLAAVLGIMRGHGGAIVVDSVLGRGTRFQILLRRSTGAPTPLTLERAPADVDFRSDAVVLLVDDDDRLRNTVARMLAMFGARVLEAGDGEAACEILRSRGPEISLVLLDLTMPGMSGKETLLALREIRPDVRIVIMSGYSEDEVRVRLVEQDMIRFLHKPFSLETLADVLRQAPATAGTESG